MPLAEEDRWADITEENISAAIEAGVTIALGADSGKCPHAENLSELGHLVELGMDSARQPLQLPVTRSMPPACTAPPAPSPATSAWAPAP
ncbi:hypothetical protein [Streptomyces sp. NPDC050848]|uniref:hypothetical protein n=1 Tax=Streptomyces sp. NPDC050848 TaxID=3155791 RepID=UPI0033C89B72